MSKKPFRYEQRFYSCLQELSKKLSAIDPQGEAAENDNPQLAFIEKLSRLLSSVECSKSRLANFLESEMKIELPLEEFAKSKSRIELVQRVLQSAKDQSAKQPKENPLKWMRVDCPYEALQHKLKKSIIQNMNQYQNQQIIQYFQKKNQGRLERVDPRLESFITPQNKVLLKVSSRGKAVAQRKSEWTKEHELLYRAGLLSAKRQYSKGLQPQRCSVKKFNERRSLSQKAIRTLALQPFSHQVCDEGSIRPAILSKFFSGAVMQAQQMRVLLSTSPLLQQCIDKNSINRTLTIVDESVVESILAAISNAIVEEWRKNKEARLAERLAYIKRENAVKLARRTSTQTQGGPKGRTVLKRSPSATINLNSQSFQVAGRDSRLSIAKSRVKPDKDALRRHYTGGPNKFLKPADILNQAEPQNFFLASAVNRQLKSGSGKQEQPLLSKSGLKKKSVLQRRSGYRAQPEQPLSPKKKTSSKKEVTALSLESAITRKIFSLVKAQHMGELTRLVAEPALFDKHDRELKTPLFWACEKGFEAVVMFLLAKGADPNKPCLNGSTPCHAAFMSNNVEVIIQVITNGGDLSIANDLGQTPLALGNQLTIEHLGLKDAVAFLPRSSFV